MKKKYLIAEFLVIFMFLVIPPLLQGPGNESVEIAYGGRLSFSVLMQALISILILMQDKKIHFIELQDDSSKIKTLIRFMTWCPICLGLTMLTQAFLAGISMIFPFQEQPSIVFPKDRGGWIIYFVNLLVAVVYEETIYRLFLPDLLIKFSDGGKNLLIPIEIFCILIFSFSHRYLGYLAVINAAICGAFLRLTKLKSKKIWAGVLAHFLYNTLQTVFIGNI